MKALVLFLGLGLLVSTAQALSPFSGLPAEYNQEKNRVEVTNMPRLTFQHGVNNCYAHTAGTLLQAEYCRQNSLDCTNLPSNQLFSVLDLSRFQFNSISAGYNDKGEELFLSEYYRENFEGLYVKGGQVSAVLDLVNNVERVVSEECFSLENFMTKPFDYDFEIEGWVRLENIYDEVRVMIKDLGACVECAQKISGKILSTYASEIKKYFNLKITDDVLVMAFDSPNYGVFINKITGLAQCSHPKKRIRFKNKGQTIFVEPAKTSSTNSEMRSYISKVLKTGRPVGLSNICTDYEMPNLSCAKGVLHSVVISGEKELCNSKNDCHVMYKVINSAWQEWLDIKAGGDWLYSERLLNSVIQPRKNVLIHYGEPK